MIALDLCQPHYQVLLIIYPTFTAKNIEIKAVNQHEILLGLIIIDYVTNAKMWKWTARTNKWANQKVFKYTQIL